MIAFTQLRSTAAALALLAAAPVMAQDDAVWIETHLRNGGGTAIGPAPQHRKPDAISVATIGRHVGKDVRLHLTSGRVREGLLERVDGGELYLRSPMGGGYATVSYKRSQVTKAELK